MDLIRVVFQWFGTLYVTLVDHDGDRTICRVFWLGGRAHAKRYGMAVLLLDDGKVSGVSFVSGWEPYDASSPKELPRAIG